MDYIDYMDYKGNGSGGIWTHELLRETIGSGSRLTELWYWAKIDYWVFYYKFYYLPKIQDLQLFQDF